MKKLIGLSMFAVMFGLGSADAATITLVASDDTYIDAANPDENYGSEGLLQFNEGNEGLRWLAKWDLSSLSGTLTPNVDTAYIRMSMERAGQANQGMGGAYIETDWSEDTATWNSVGGDTTNWGAFTPGGTRLHPNTPNSNPADPDVTGLTGAYKYYSSGDVAPASAADAVMSTWVIAGWLDGSIANNGMMGKHWGGDKDIRYWSKEGAASIDDKPLLIIESDSVSVIPEPAMAGMMVLGGLVTLLRRTRR